MPKGIEGASHIESKKVAIRVLTDINKLPKDPKKWDKGVIEYKLIQDGKRYLFKRDGTAGIFNAKTNKYDIAPSSLLVSKIKSLDRNKKSTQKDLKDLKTLANRNTQNKKEILSNEVLLEGLKGLIRKGKQSDINAHLDRNRDQYVNLVNSSSFQEEFKDAIANPEKNALTIQLYAQFFLHDTTIVIDGKYGNQTRDIIAQYINSSDISEKRSEERKKRLESITNGDSMALTKQEENTKGIVDKIIISEENEHRYAKIFDLDETTINSLTRNKEKKKKTPEELAKSYTSKKKALFDIAKASAKKGCINYLQQLFKQTINVPGNPENLQKLFDNLNLSDGVTSHEQSVDFDVTLNGKPFSMCYNICDGELKYTPLFMKNEGGDLLKGGPSEEKVLIPKGTMPSLISMLTDAKSGAESAAKTESSNRKGVISGIKSIEKAVPNLQSNQDVIANAVAQESCMQSFLDLTGYDVSQKLDKTTYGNTQLYMLHDMFQHTFNQKGSNPVDMYRLKHLIEKVKKIKNEYQDSSKILKKNIRSEQFSEQKIKNDKLNILAPKADSAVKNSLSFYNFFSQYINPTITDPKQPGYRVLDINKIEADLLKADNEKFLSDDIIQKTIAINEEKSEKEKADDFLEKNWA